MKNHGSKQKVLEGLTRSQRDRFNEYLLETLEETVDYETWEKCIKLTKEKVQKYYPPEEKKPTSPPAPPPPPAQPKPPEKT